MRLTIHDSVPVEWWERCAEVAAKFAKEHPMSTSDEHDRIYRAEYADGTRMGFYVAHTKGGRVSVRAWDERSIEDRETTE